MTASLDFAPAPQPVFLDRFKAEIRAKGSDAARSSSTLVDCDERDELFYVPFEHMNLDAKIVIVGITPGPNQIALSYETVRAGLIARKDDATILSEAKAVGSFGGPQMRPNLLKLLTETGVSRVLGLQDPKDLWGVASHLLHATSVVPHAAFRRGKPFAGSFKDVQGSRVFSRCFERDFASTLPLINPAARYIALGPTPLAALDWCVDRGLLRSEQVLGAFPHPSSNAGSQVSVYLGKRRADDLDQNDPVRSRAGWLVEAAERMRKALKGADAPKVSALANGSGETRSAERCAPNR